MTNKQQNDATKNAGIATLSFIEALGDTSMGGKTVVSLSLPNNKILYKMMRGCIGIEDPKELWMYTGSNDDAAYRSPIAND